MKPFATLKSVAATLGALLLFSALGVGQAIAQDGTTLSIESQEAQSGEAVDVPVQVTNFNDVGSISLTINYDPAVLSFPDGADTDQLISDTPRSGFTANVPESGTLKISWFDGTGQNPINLGDGQLLTLNFDNFAGGTSDVAFGSESEIANIEAQTIDATFNGGVVASALGSLSVGTVEDASLNQTASVPLSGEDLENVGSVSLEVEFDSTVARFEGIANDNSGLDLQASASDGVITIGGFNASGTSLGSNFAELEFTFLGGSTSPQFLETSEVTDVESNELPVDFASGSLTGDEPTVFVSDQEAAPGQTITVPVEASDLQEVGSASIDLTFNPTVLTFEGSQNPIEGFNLQVNSPETGVVRIAGFSANGVDPSQNNDRFVDLRFTVDPNTSPGNQTTVDFNTENSELTNPNSVAYNTSFNEGSFTFLARRASLSAQALDLTSGDTELRVDSVIANAGDAVVVTTDDGDGEFTDEEVVGSASVGSNLDSEEVLVDVEGASPTDHAAHVSTDGTVGGVVATSQTAPVYAVSQFSWEDETSVGAASTVTVDSIEVLYDGTVGPDTLSIDLHEVSGGAPGAFVGVSQEDLAVGEVHTDVAVDVVEPVDPTDSNPERIESTIEESGEYFAMAHLGAAGTDADGERIPAQQPALQTTTGLGTVGDFAAVTVEPADLAVDVSRSFDDASDPANYELVALPGSVDVDVAQTVSGSNGTDWRAFLELGASEGDEDASLQDYADEAFNFRPGRGVWILAKSDWSFQGTVPAVSADDGTPSVALQDGWNAVSNPLRADLAWSDVQQASDLEEALWRWNGSWQRADTLSSATTGEAYYVFNGAGVDSLEFTSSASATTTLATASGGNSNTSLRTVELSATTEEKDVSSTVTVGLNPKAEERSSYRAPPAHFGGTALRIMEGDPAKSYMRMVAATDEETAQFDLSLQAEPGASVQIGAGDLPEDVSSNFGIVLIDGNATHDLRNGSATVTVDEKEGSANLKVQLGNAEKIAQQTAPDETQLKANYPNPFSGQTTIEYTVAEQSDVNIRVYNVLGQQVATLARGKKQAGTYRVDWEGRNLSSGKYFVRIEANGTTDTHQITVVR